MKRPQHRDTRWPDFHAPLLPFRSSSWALVPCQGTCFAHLVLYDADGVVGADAPLSIESADRLIELLQAAKRGEFDPDVGSFVP